MTAASPKLPGRLGDPNLTLATDPRTDPRVIAALAQSGMDAVEEAPSVGPGSPYAEIIEYVGALEAGIDAVNREMFGRLPPVTGVARRTEVIKGQDGNEIRLFIHEPSGRAGPRPGILHTHGGGMAICAAADPQSTRWRDELAATGLSVVGVEFRNSAGKLGPCPFPAGLDDCAAGAHWTHENRDALGISQLVVSGESGGGNLSLALALKAKREGWIHKIAGVYAMCPYISGTYSPAPPELTSLHENAGYVVDADMMQVLATAYDPGGENTDNPLAWPYRASVEDLAGLPPHAISVNELDPLRDEGLHYARRLMAAGVPTLSRTINGTNHGGDTELLAVMPDVYYASIRDVHGFAASL